MAGRKLFLNIRLDKSRFLTNTRRFQPVENTSICSTACLQHTSSNASCFATRNAKLSSSTRTEFDPVIRFGKVNGSTNFLRSDPFSRQFHKNFSKGAVCSPGYLSQCRNYSTGDSNDVDRNRSNQPDPGRPTSYLKLMDMNQIVWPNFVKSLRNKFFKFIISKFYDPSFNAETFMDGAEQATKIVSNLVSEGKWDELRGFVEDDAISEIKDNYAKLNVKQRKYIAVDPKDFLLRFMYEIGMVFDDHTKQRFVEITMVFQGLHGLHDLKEQDSETYYKEIPNRAEEIFICNYRFIREYTKGVEDDWTISGLNHFSPKEVVDTTPPFSR